MTTGSYLLRFISCSLNWLLLVITSDNTRPVQYKTWKIKHYWFFQGERAPPSVFSERSLKSPLWSVYSWSALCSLTKELFKMYSWHFKSIPWRRWFKFFSPLPAPLYNFHRGLSYPLPSTDVVFQSPSLFFYFSFDSKQEMHLDFEISFYCCIMITPETPLLCFLEVYNFTPEVVTILIIFQKYCFIFS